MFGLQLFSQASQVSDNIHHSFADMCNQTLVLLFNLDKYNSQTSSW